MTKYSLTTIRRKARNAGYLVEKGFQHYLYNNSVLTNSKGERLTGYNVLDLSTGLYVLESGCYDNNFDHLCTLENVEIFIRSVYEKAGLEY